MSNMNFHTTFDQDMRILQTAHCDTDKVRKIYKLAAKNHLVSLSEDVVTILKTG